MQCVIMTLVFEIIANDVSKMRKVIEFQSLCPATPICAGEVSVIVAIDK